MHKWDVIAKTRGITSSFQTIFCVGGVRSCCCCCLDLNLKDAIVKLTMECDADSNLRDQMENGVEQKPVRGQRNEHANQNAYMIHGSSAMNVVDTVAGVAVLYPAHNILGKVGCEENKSGRQLTQ